MNKFAIKTDAWGTLSDEQLHDFCRQNDQLLIERNKNKELIIMSPTGFNTGARNNEIALQLGLWNRKHKLGIVGDSSTGFVLPNGEMRSPDASWVLLSRVEAIPAVKREKFLPLCPDFVIELLSSTDEVKDLQDKIQHTWIANGCKLAWLIDPFEEEVHVYRANGTSNLIATFDEVVSGEDVLPHFNFDLQELRL